jgi:prepilin-type N-terminal cleavage/methylation domain-containing protein
MTTRRPPRDDDGYTLIEVILAVAIMGITFVAVLSGIATTVVTARVHRDQADVSTVLVSASERVKAAAYVPGATSATYLGAAQTAPSLPAGWTSSVIVIPAVDSVTSLQNPLFWDGTTFQATPFDNPLGTPPVIPLQQIKITVTSPDNRAVQSMYVVKRG